MSKLAVTGLGWIVVPVAVLLGAVVVEYLARWWVRHGKAYYVFTPGLRLRLHPHPQVFPQVEPSVRFEVNAQGERGYEVPRLRAGEKLYRVLVAGGSQPEGYLLDQDTSWPGALHRLLQRPDHLAALGASKAHVGSVARSGVGSEALGRILERVLSRYDRLQAIIILVGASDVLRWLEQGGPAAPPSSPSTSDLFGCHPEVRLSWRRRKLALVELIGRTRHRWLRPVKVHEGAGSWIGKARAMRAHAKVIRTTMPPPGPMLDHFEHHFRQVLGKAKDHAERVLVVQQPWFDRPFAPEEAAQMWHGGAGQVWREEVTTYYSFEVVSRLMALVNKRAARVAREMEVEQLDLMPVLERSLVTYYDGFHATPTGARMVAAAVADAVLQRSLPASRVLERTDRLDPASSYSQRTAS